MRGGLKIILGIGLYSVVETALLCTALNSGPGDLTNKPNSYQLTVFFSQLLLIPGLGGVLSRVNYGPHRWNRQTFAILSVGALTLPVTFAVLMRTLLFSEWVSSLGLEAYVDILAALVPIITLIAGVTGGFVWVAKRSMKRSIELEANRWLAERQSGATQKERKQRLRGVQIASCIPVLLVLSVFLLLPRIWAFVSHLEVNEAGKLAGFEVSLPGHWIVIDHVRQGDGWSFVDGIIFDQNTFAVLKRRSPGLPLSAWSFSTQPYKPDSYAPPSEDQFIAKRVFEVANESVTCLEYRTAYTYGSADANESSSVHVQCTSSGRLGGSFTGYRDNLQTFYKILQDIQKGK